MKLVNLLEVIYPVGSLYFSTNPQSPSEIIGGIWEVLEENRYICTTGLNFDAGLVGGNDGFTLGVNHIPSHNHKVTIYNYSPNSTANQQITWGNSIRVEWKDTTTSSVGGGQKYTYWPRFYTVNIWRRIS